MLPFTGLGNRVVPFREGAWGQGLTPQDEAGEVIKSGFEHVEIEVSVTSQERWPVVIGMCWSTERAGQSYIDPESAARQNRECE